MPQRDNTAVTKGKGFIQMGFATHGCLHAPSLRLTDVSAASHTRHLATITVVARAASVVSMVASLGRRQPGVDIIAALSLVGTWWWSSICPARSSP